MEFYRMDIAVTILIIAIIILRSLLMDRLPKTTFLFLWGVVLFRLLVPFKIPLPIGNMPLLKPFEVTEKGMKGINHFTWRLSGSANAVHVESDGYGHALNVSAVQVMWLIGCSALVIYFFMQYLRMWNRLRYSIPLSDNEYIENWLSGISMFRNIKIMQNDRIQMPVAVGIWNPKIILPKKMDYCNYRYMDFVLNHELVHIKRLDMLWKSCMVLALSLYWMNPFIWAMYILFVRDLEIACDERIIKKFGKESSSEYAYALVHFAENQNSVSSVYFNSFSKNSLEERIVLIVNKKTIGIMSCVAAVAIVVAVMLVFIVSPKNVSAEDVTIAKEEKDAKASTEESADGDGAAWQKQKQESVSYEDIDGEDVAWAIENEDELKLYDIYKEYGITFNEGKDELYYNGKLVRVFEDETIFEDGTSAGDLHYTPEGKIDIQVVRKENLSIDSIKELNDDEFRARNIEEVKKKIEDRDKTKGEAWAIEPYPDVDMEETYGVYKDFGLEYDSGRDCLIFDGKVVRNFIDVYKEGVEEGGALTRYDEKGVIDVKTVRDFKNGGTLIRLEMEVLK